MKEKICLFSRVSTTIQDLTSQENTLIQAALADGYSEDQFIIISEHESGVKNTIKDRIGISKAIDAVLNENVKVIYCFELSRVARRLDVFYEFRTFLIEHKVQLIILQPSVKLLNDNGEIDENFSLVFSIFASLAEQEARLMKSRLKRGKDERRSINKFCDGYPAYGYIREKDGTLLIDEEEAEIVRHVFAEYNSGKIVDEIAKDLIANNVVNKTLRSARGFCFHILHNCIYCGRPTTENKFCNTHVKHGYVYPALITEEEFDKADATFIKRKKRPKTNTKNTWLCRGLLVNEKGLEYHVHITNKMYYTVETTKEYTKTTYIPKDKVEGLVWNKVVDIVMNKPSRSKEEIEKDFEKKIKAVDMQLSETEARISEIDAKIKKIEYRIINGKLNEDLGDEMKENFSKERMKLNSSKLSLVSDRDTLSKKMINLSNSSLEVTRDEILNYSEEEKEKLIKEEVKQIVAVKKAFCEITLLILFNECTDPEIFKLEYREYKKKPRLNV